MADELLISAREELVFAAEVSEGTLTGLSVYPVGSHQIGNIYLARVERVMSRLNAAFLDIGEDNDGFLGAREARCLIPNPPHETKIQDCVNAGDIILVQAQRQAQGDKGASVTADVSLAGHALVLTPCRLGIAVSRSIEDRTERTRLVTLVGELLTAHPDLVCSGLDGAAGWLLRTAAEGLEADAILADMQMLAASWRQVSEDADTAHAPYLLYEDLDAVARILRDRVQVSTRSIVVEDEAAFTSANDYCVRALPQAKALLRAGEAGESVFEAHDIEGEITRARAVRVDLSGGGDLIFERTAAMVTIDVNSGSAAGDEALSVNLEAAREVARQIILRGLGGLIAIDFIDMQDASAREQLMLTLEAGFADDKMPVRIGPFSEFGVVELTRRRAPYGLADALRGI